MRSPKIATVRRSVALPKSLVDDLTRAAPPELKSNLNRLVIVALGEFIKSRRRIAFEQAMSQMAADPAALAEIAAIQEEFRPADSDGLGEKNAARRNLLR
jgi:hypothetical protein